VKINDALSSAAGLPAGPQATRADKPGGTVDNTPPPSHNVQISTLSSQLQALQGTQAGSAVYEAKKVEEIKSAIAQGRFQINSDKVADGLLQSVQDLINSKKQ
jgi:negative regulator of flagellin synthesis FlgM